MNERKPISLSQKKTVYFDKSGEQNTDMLLKYAKEYAEKENIEDIVVASTTGKTGTQAAKAFKGRNVVIVSHNVGFQEPGKSELQDEYKKEMLTNGAKLFTGVHALSSVERAVRKNFGTIQPLELIGYVLRLMGEGTKVCVEIAIMAADAGLIPTDKDIIAIGGSGRGADTALRLRPANAARFFDMRIREVIAKPSNF